MYLNNIVSINQHETLENDEFEILRKKYECLKSANFYPKQVTIPENFDGIKSLDEFVKKYSDKDGKLSHYYIRLYEFLSKIEERVSKGIDPIKYLYYLYFELKISTIDIYKTLGGYGGYSYGYISKIFTSKFGWKIRTENIEHCNTVVRKEADRKKIKKLTLVQQNEKKENVEKVEKILDRFSREKSKKDFDLNVYNGLRNIRTKVKYLLDLAGYINGDSFECTIFKLSDKYGLKVTAQAIKNILEQEINEIGNLEKINFIAGRIVEMGKEQA